MIERVRVGTDEFYRAAKSFVSLMKFVRGILSLIRSSRRS